MTARRFVLIALMFLLPLQWSWAVAASMCQHEAGTRQGTHFGHHVHACSDEGRKAPEGKSAAHADCASCHAATFALCTDTQAGAASAPASTDAPATLPAFSSALPRAPDRPQWLRLV